MQRKQSGRDDDDGDLRAHAVGTLHIGEIRQPRVPHECPVVSRQSLFWPAELRDIGGGIRPAGVRVLDRLQVVSRRGLQLR